MDGQLYNVIIYLWTTIYIRVSFEQMFNAHFEIPCIYKRVMYDLAIIL